MKIKTGFILIEPEDLYNGTFNAYIVKRYILGKSSYSGFNCYDYLYWDCEYTEQSHSKNFSFSSDILYTDIFEEMKTK